MENRRILFARVSRQDRERRAASQQLIGHRFCRFEAEIHVENGGITSDITDQPQCAFHRCCRPDNLKAGIAQMLGDIESEQWFILDDEYSKGRGFLS